MENTAFNIIDLDLGYPNKKGEEVILKNLNFNISKGSLVALIGANGSGKSTLLRTLAKQQAPLSGTIEVDQKEQTDYSSLSWAQKVAWVHTENNLSQNLSVAELVSLGRQPYTNWLDRLHQKDIETVKQAMLFTEVEHLSQKKCFELSDGQLQRALISRAIAQDTDIILLDEPTTHLDIHHKVNTLSLLQKLCNTLDKTILFSTHEIELALQVCDLFLCIHNGKVDLCSKSEIIESDILNVIFKHSSLYFDARQERFIFK